MKTTKSQFSSERGSLLIVALLLSAVIGIFLASYLNLGRSSLNISNRALYNNAAINLAENGLEEAMYSVNQVLADPTYTWPGWSNDGTNPTSAAWRTFTGFNLDQNTTGQVQVYVYNYKGVNPPKIVAHATVRLGGAASAPIEKWLEVTLRRTSKFSNGLVAKESIIFNGNNATVDSWNSDPDSNTVTPAIPYSTGVRNDQGSVGSISVAVDAVLVKQADIWGYVATASADPTGAVGANGSIMGADSSTDHSTWVNPNVDPNRVSTDFVANFDPVSAPAASYTVIPSITASTTLPRVGDSPAADGKYYYQANQVNFNNATLSVTGNVVLSLTNTSTGIDIGGGTGNISIAAGTGALEIYTPGDIKIAGQGVANGGTTDLTANQPIKFQVWGTKTTGSQDIMITGNGVLSGTVYAPQGRVAINGNGSVSGSIVANNITLVGNANFHYDESLGAMGNDAYRVSKWKELTSGVERSGYAGVMAF